MPRRRVYRILKEAGLLHRLSLAVLPRSALGEAIGYPLNNWKALPHYTEAPFLAIDNNHSERQIKQLVIGRKNWLFAGSEGGAKNAAILYSLVVSCKLAGVDPFTYFRDVLMRIHTHPAERIAELTLANGRRASAPPLRPPFNPQRRSSAHAHKPQASPGPLSTCPWSSAHGLPGFTGTVLVRCSLTRRTG